MCLWTMAWVAVLPGQNLDDLLGRVASFEYGQDRKPLADFEAWMRDQFSRRADMKATERRLVQFLEGKATAAGKDFACRQMSLIGTETSVPVLAKMLAVPEMAEIARYALERIPVRQAMDALRAQLGKTSGRQRIGLINSLGVRRDAASAGSLSKLMREPDAETAAAAAGALGRIGNPEARKALEQAAATTGGKLRVEVLEALLSSAEQLVKAGQTPEAARICRLLYKDTEPEMIRVAALRGLAAALGREATPLLIEALRDNRSAPVRTAAISFLAAGGEVQVLMKELPALPPEFQARVIAALGERGDAAARPAVMAVLKSPDPAVRIAALESLATLGDATVVAVLAEAAANSPEAEQNAARTGLYRLRGKEVDQAIVSGVREGTGKARLELIRASGERGIPGAAGPLMTTAADTDTEVRRESLRSLREVAGAGEVPGLLRLLGSAKTSTDRRETERTLTAAVRRSGRPWTAELTSAYRSAGDAATQSSVLLVMALTGSKETTPLFREAIQSSNLDTRRAAILALTEWPGTEPAADLLRAASAESSPTLQVLAVRGYLRLVTQPSTRPSAETAKLLADAVPMAKQPEEKKTILAALQKTVCPESLELAESMMNDAAVANEAKLAAESLRKALQAARR